MAHLQAFRCAIAEKTYLVIDSPYPLTKIETGQRVRLIEKSGYQQDNYGYLFDISDDDIGNIITCHAENKQEGERIPVASISSNERPERDFPYLVPTDVDCQIAVYTDMEKLELTGTDLDSDPIVESVTYQLGGGAGRLKWLSEMYTYRHDHNAIASHSKVKVRIRRPGTTVIKTNTRPKG